MRHALPASCLFFLLAALAAPAADEPAWTVLVGEDAGDVWKGKLKGWIKADSVALDENNKQPRRQARQGDPGQRQDRPWNPTW